MNMWLWIFISILVLVIVILTIKIYMLKKSAREIRQEFADRLMTDTNILIDISCHDRNMRELADSINTELRNLRRERHRYQQGDRELKEVITNTSHDLRTPLTAICGYLGLLEREEKSENVERYLGIIKNRTEVLKQLTEELFRYSIVSSTDDYANREPVVLNAVLEESILAYYAALTGCHITPDISMPEDKVIRNLNRQALSRIFGNIMSNVMKYSDGDLKITLLESGKIIFSNHASGLDEVQVGQLFDRFYTVETGAKSTGLGLSIARALTEQMDGSISADYKNGMINIYIQFDVQQGKFDV